MSTLRHRKFENAIREIARGAFLTLRGRAETSSKVSSSELRVPGVAIFPIFARFYLTQRRRDAEFFWGGFAADLYCIALARHPSSPLSRVLCPVLPELINHVEHVEHVGVGGVGGTSWSSRVARQLLVMRFALEDYDFASIANTCYFINKSIHVVNPSRPASLPILERFGFADTSVAVAINVIDKFVDALERLFVLELPASVFVPRAWGKNDIHEETLSQASIKSRFLASPRSYERIDSANTRWLASAKKGSGFSATTSNGRRWRMTDWRRNRRTALEMSSPAREKNSSASWRKSLSTRICSVDVVISHSFVVQMSDSISYLITLRKGDNCTFSRKYPPLSRVLCPVLPELFNYVEHVERVGVCRMESRAEPQSCRERRAA